MPFAPPFSKLPRVGTTIFTVMSQLAAEHSAVNLGQGFPDFDVPPFLVEALAQAMREGHNQYPPGQGVPELRHAVADHVALHTGLAYDPDSEVLVTVGATEAIAGAVVGLVEPAITRKPSMHPAPSMTSATTGPSCMYSTSSGKKGFAA